MARDRAKNAYYTVGIPLDSEALHRLRADSEETGVSIPQLLAVRIADWYRFTVEMKSALPVHPGAVPESGIHAASAHDHDSANGNGLQNRASAAALTWGGGEEE
jgi:hypothetical protein